MHLRWPESLGPRRATGLHTKILRRLGESAAGVALNGPSMRIGADVREERVARRRARLNRGPRESGDRDRAAARSAWRGRWRPRLCGPAVVVKRTRIGAPPDRRRTPRAQPGRLLPVPAGDRRQSAAGRAAAAFQSISPSRSPSSRIVEPLARDRAEPGRRHVVAEDRRHGDRVLAVRGEQMIDEQSATRAERQPFDVIVLRACPRASGRSPASAAPARQARGG